MFKKSLLILFVFSSISVLAFSDLDKDLITDTYDLCPNTAQNMIVDEYGCSCSQKQAAGCNELYNEKVCCSSFEKCKVSDIGIEPIPRDKDCILLFDPSIQCDLPIIAADNLIYVAR